MFKRIVMLCAVIAAGSEILEGAPKCEFWSWAYVHEKELDEAVDRLNTVNKGQKRNPTKDGILVVKLTGDVRPCLARIKEGKFSFVKLKDKSNGLKENNLEEVDDSVEGKKLSNGDCESQISFLRIMEYISRAKSGRQRYSTNSATYKIQGLETPLPQDKEYINAERRFTAIGSTLKLEDLPIYHHKYIVIQIDTKWTLFIVNYPKKETRTRVESKAPETYILSYGKHITSDNRFEVGTKDEAEASGKAIIESIASDIDKIKKTVEDAGFEPTIYVINESNVTKATGKEIDPNYGLSDAYIKEEVKSFKSKIQSAQKQLSLDKPEDIQEAAALNIHFLSGYYSKIMGDTHGSQSRVKESREPNSCYMKNKDSNNFVKITFGLNPTTDQLTIEVGDDQSADKQIEQDMLRNIEQQGKDESLFLNVDQLKSKSKIEQIATLYDFFTGKKNVGDEFNDVEPGLCITKLKSMQNWDSDEYFKGTNIGSGSLVYVPNDKKDGRNIFCKSKNTANAKPLNELNINDLETADINASKNDFAGLFIKIAEGIIFKYKDDQHDLKASNTQSAAKFFLQHLGGKQILTMYITDKGGETIDVVPGEFDSLNHDTNTITFVRAEKAADKNPVKRHLDLNRLCIGNDQNIDDLFKSKDFTVIESDQNPTDHMTSFETQVKVLLKFFLEGKQHPSNTKPYDKRIVLHKDKLDKWEIGSTEAFLEDDKFQYRCLKSKSYIRGGNAIGSIDAEFSDSDSSKKSLMIF